MGSSGKPVKQTTKQTTKRRKPPRVQHGFDFGYWHHKITWLAEQLDELHGAVPAKLRPVVGAAIRGQINLRANLQNIQRGSREVFAIEDGMEAE